MKLWQLIERWVSRRDIKSVEDNSYGPSDLTDEYYTHTISTISPSLNPAPVPPSMSVLPSSAWVNYNVVVEQEPTMFKTCGAVAHLTGWCCTREPWHSGNHVATIGPYGDGENPHVLGEWSDDAGARPEADALQGRRAINLGGLK